MDRGSKAQVGSVDPQFSYGKGVGQVIFYFPLIEHSRSSKFWANYVHCYFIGTKRVSGNRNNYIHDVVKAIMCYLTHSPILIRPPFLQTTEGTVTRPSVYNVQCCHYINAQEMLLPSGEKKKEKNSRHKKNKYLRYCQELYTVYTVLLDAVLSTHTVVSTMYHDCLIAFQLCKYNLGKLLITAEVCSTRAVA